MGMATSPAPTPPAVARPQGNDGVGATVPAGKPRRVRRQVPFGRAYVIASYNNTLITFTDPQGNVLVQGSSGRSGFRGPKKATPYAAGAVIRDVMPRLHEYGVREVNVFVRGLGSGREAAIRAMNAQGLAVASIKDITPLPHNGCRPKKPRRI